MKKTICAVRGLLVPVAMGIVTLTVMSVASLSIAQAQADKSVEVTITDMGFTVKGHMTTESLTAITVYNKGTIPHGITSSAFKKGVLKKQGDGVEMTDSKNKGFMAYHLDPGKSMTLRFVKESHSASVTETSGTVQVPFWCDIHAHMKGEFVILETRGEVGGM